MREIVIGGAQMGPIQRADTREAVVARMIALLEDAYRAGCKIVIVPELCLTTFFPRSTKSSTRLLNIGTEVGTYSTAGS